MFTEGLKYMKNIPDIGGYGIASNKTGSIIIDGVNLNIINDNRFKTGKISATILVPLERETAAKNALLIQLLSRSCEKFPDNMALNRHLGNLYGADVSAYCRKIGDFQVLTLSLGGLDDRYTIANDNIYENLVSLLCEMLFHPNIKDGKFDTGDFEQEKRQLLEEIDSEFNEKRLYALGRMTEIMCADEACGIRRYGSREDVEVLTASDVADAWKTLLEMGEFEFMLIGNSVPDNIADVLKTEFSKVERRFENGFKTKIVRKVDKVKEEIEETDVAQSKLVMGFRAKTAYPQGDVTTAWMMATVLGGTPSSKLFMNVREKHSLCYYCAARYDKNKGIIVVDCGVEKKNIERAKQEILNQLEILQSGDLIDEEISSAKLSLCNSISAMDDTVTGVELWYVSQLKSGGFMTTKEACKAVNAVTKEEIINSAKLVELDTVYVLTGDEAEDDEDANEGASEQEGLQ